MGYTTLNNQPDEHQRRSTSGIDEQCTAHRIFRDRRCGELRTTTGALRQNRHEGVIRVLLSSTTLHLLPSKFRESLNLDYWGLAQVKERDAGFERIEIQKQRKLKVLKEENRRPLHSVRMALQSDPIIRLRVI